MFNTQNHITAPKPEPNALCAKDASCSVTPSCVTSPPSLAARTQIARARIVNHSFHRVSSRERDGRRGRGRGRARRARRIDRSIAVVAGRGADAPYPRAEARWERCVADRRILAPRRRRAPRAEDMVTATRRTRSEGRGFARGRGAKTRGTRGTGSERARAGGERWCEGDGDA